MASGGASKAFFHVVSGYIFGPYFDISLLVSCVIDLIIKFFHVFEL